MDDFGPSAYRPGTYVQIPSVTHAYLRNRIKRWHGLSEAQDVGTDATNKHLQNGVGVGTGCKNSGLASINWVNEGLYALGCS
jgi:hypothetical protein